MHRFQTVAIQYLHFKPLKTASWTHKEIFGSKFVSFARIAICCWYIKSCEDCGSSVQLSQFKKNFILLQKESFCLPTVVLLLSHCCPFALQKWSFWTERSPESIKTWTICVAKPLKTPSQISIIDFCFVTLFYCLYDICQWESCGREEMPNINKTPW